MITEHGSRFLNENSPQVNEFEDDVAIEIIEQLLIEELGEDTITELIDANNPELGLLVQEGLLSERTIVRLDRRAKKSRAFTQAVYQVAKENNDRDFRKLVTIWKVRRALENKIVKKYSARAKQRVKSGKKILGGQMAAKIVERLKNFTPMKLGGGVTQGLNKFMGQKAKTGRGGTI